MQHSGFGDMRSQMKGLSLIHGLRTPMQRQRSGSGEMKSWESQVRTRTCIRLMRIDVSFLKLQLSYPMLSNLLYPTYILPLCSDRRTPMMRRASGEMRSYKSQSRRMHGSWHLFQRFCCMRVPAATRTNQCCLGRRHFKEMALQPRSCWNLSTANLQGSLFLISGVDQQAQFLI